MIMDDLGDSPPGLFPPGPYKYLDNMCPECGGLDGDHDDDCDEDNN